MSENNSISPDTQPRKATPDVPPVENNATTSSENPTTETPDTPDFANNTAEEEAAAINPESDSPESEPSDGTPAGQVENISPDTQPVKKKSSGRFGFIIALILMLGALVSGSMGGYNWGITQRLEADQGTKTKSLGEQFTLAQEDFLARRYELARQRLDFILRQDPNYPGAKELFTQALVELAITASPTVTSTPTLTPTPDVREQETIFAQAQAQLASSDWEALTITLDTLRKKDQAYRAAEVDGMYYVALRNRGVAKILGTGPYQTAPNLEGGMYDLTVAERFGPLDGQADGMRNFARMYILGASFWGLDWGQAVNYFGQVYRFTPNLRDGSNMTATERYRSALLYYGDQLAAAQKEKDRCMALPQWETANQIRPLDGEYGAKYERLHSACFPATPTLEPNNPEPVPTLDK